MKSLPTQITPSNPHPQLEHLLSKAINPKNIDRIHKRRVIIPIECQIHSIPRNHLRGPHGIQIVDVDIIRVPVSLYAEDPRLTACSGANVRALGAVVVEEAVQAHAVAEDVVRAQDAEAPAGGGIDARRGGEDGVGESRVLGEGDGGVGVGLVVGGFGLDLAHEDLAGVDELVFVFDVVLDCGAIAMGC